MPPTSPPMNGRAFQSASDTVRPKPSRVDFWISTSACDWKAFTSIDPTLLRLLRILMSGSPAAYSSVELKNSQPSGSSVAIDPTSASCTSGSSSVTMRYASMTPSGSFQGSKRDTWQISGRSTSTPNWSQTNDASSGESAMFLGDSGSIAGGQMCTGVPSPSASGTYPWTWKTEASYSCTSPTTRSIVGGCGVDRSIWQRHTQLRA